MNKDVRSRNARPHDAHKLRISLKQWRMLHAVIDCGGFAEAAKCLHLSQSAISYTIAKMQEQLGVSILQLVGRKAQITEAGRALLQQSRCLLKEALALEAYAEHLRHGGGAEVRLVADHDFPASLLMLALRQFAHVRSGTQVCLSEVTMQQAARALSDRTADLAISTHIPPGFLGDPLMELEYVAVAHPEHGLFRLGHPITVADLTRQVKIVVGHSTDLLHGTKPSPGCLQHWNVSSVDTAMEALHACLGYAWLPRHRIRDRLSQGALQALPLVDGGVFSAIFYLVHGHDRTPDPDAKKLAQALHRAVAMDAA